MPRIPYAAEGQEAPGATPVYQEFKKNYGMVPNLVKVVGHSAPVTQALAMLLKTYHSDLSLTPRIREVAYLTVARHNGCAYCQGHHTPVAKKAGLTDEQINLLGEAGFTSDKLTEPERAIVRFAYETSHSVAASDQAIAQLKRHFSLPEIAEIAFVVSSANFIQRIGRNFGVELER